MSKSEDIGYEDVAIRGRMDIEDIVRLQINRCNASAYEPDQTLFESSVKVLFDLLPRHKRDEILNEKELDYVEPKEFIEYGSYWCGIPMTSTKRIIKKAVINYHLLYRIILDAYADAGLTWQIQPQLVVRGKVSKTIKEPKPLVKKENQDVSN